MKYWTIMILIHHRIWTWCYQFVFGTYSR